MYIRTIYKKLLNSIKQYPVVVVTGPRQVGSQQRFINLLKIKDFIMFR